ncbi:MAG TPA: condensation domain-containing protein, partial [Candidatus Deferrimicrobium sp.]|nr:condensation domain-containing protein [Candidatus Deferrimicrobium sp.]
MLEHDKIKEAVVVCKNDGRGDAYLCAYIVRDQALAVSELRDYLAKRVPNYMIPSFFVDLDKIPLTVSGKIDRKALPEPGIKVEDIYSAPGNDIEMRLATIWSEVLGIETDKIGIDADFFALGGHSLKATIMAARIHKQWNVKIPLVEIFKTPTIREMARQITAAAHELYAAVEPVEKKDYYPLSSAQKRLYILQNMENRATGYNMPLILLLETEHGGMPEELLEKVFKQLIQRHESLRTSFIMMDEEPAQRVHDDVEFEIDKSFAELFQKRPPGEFGEPPGAIIKSFIRPFDLSCAPLLRVGLIRIEKQRFLFMLDMHHIVTDGFSQSLLIKEFTELYINPEKELAPLKIQYKDYALYQEKKLFKGQETYWLQEFPGEIPVLNLPVDFPRPLVQTFQGGTVVFTIAEIETARSKFLLKETGTTLFMFNLALFNILLSKLGDKEDIVIGTPIAARRHPDIEAVVGFFVNTLALRNYPVGEKTFKEFLLAVKEKTLMAFDNQEYPFEKLVEHLPVRRDTGRNPVFDVFFTIQEFVDTGVVLPGIKIIPYEYEDKAAKFDLALNGSEWNGGLRFSLVYSEALFKKETIERFAGYYRLIMTAVLHEPGKMISGIEIISAAEKNRVLYEFNATETEYPVDKSIVELFTAQVQCMPDRIALSAAGRLVDLTYGELAEKSNYVALDLQEKGVEPGDIVGVMMERSVEMITGILGILKAGGAYLPIDPDYPRERIDYMLKDSGAKFLVNETFFRGSRGAVLQKSPPCSLAYVIYTSGSTGKPKGVMIEHRNVIRLVMNANIIRWQEGKRLLMTGA